MATRERPAIFDLGARAEVDHLYPNASPGKASRDHRIWNSRLRSFERHSPSRLAPIRCVVILAAIFLDPW